MTRERVLACAVRLLDRGFFRVGGEDYAEENETYGLATMQQGPRDAATATSIALRLPGQERQAPRPDVVDPEVARDRRDAQAPPRRRSDELLPTSEGGRWLDVKSADINEYVKEATGGDFSRQGLPHLERDGAGRGRARVSGEAAARSKTARKRAIRRARSRRSRATWATRPPSAAPPTSTRACSTASTAG